MKKKIILSVLLFIPTFVFASENKYINTNGVEIDKSIYTEFNDVMTQKQINELTSFEYEKLKDKDIVSYSSEEKYFKNVYVMDSEGNVLDSYLFEMNEDDYNSDEILTPSENFQVNSTWMGGDNTIQTDYKKLKISAARDISNRLSVTLTNTWKKIPAVKEYDILGFRVSDSSAITYLVATYSASQVYDGTTASYKYNTSGNTVQAKSGIAQIMNIVNSTSKSLSNNLYITLFGNSTMASGFTLTASYQHGVNAQNTFDQVKNVTFSASGLGGVFKYPTKVANNFDKMAGVSLLAAPKQ